MEIDSGMWKDYFMNIVNNQVNLFVLLFSIFLSILFFYLFKKSDKINKKFLYLYSGIAFIFAPLIFGAFNWHWHSMMSIFHCKPKQIMVLLPSSILGAFSFGFFVIPNIYRKANSSIEVKSKRILDFVKIQSRKLGINVPRIYSINTAKPLAHSFTNIKPSIFVSVGMFELLTKKEINAVLLHELYHIKQRFSFSKFSTFFSKIFIPTPSFMSLITHLNKEENKADNYACRVQKTDRYILNAKKKIRKFLDEY